jgi:hypothetical protein
LPAVVCERSITETRLTPANLLLLRRADAIVNDALFKHGLVRKLSQVSVFLPPFFSCLWRFHSLYPPKFTLPTKHSLYL